MNIRAILIDDEKHNLDNLAALLKAYCPEVILCGAALSAASARELIRTVQPELLFLDIQMPRESGFDLLISLPDYDFEIICITAYDQHAIRAIRFSAVDYLLKPVDIAELQAAVRKAIDHRSLKQTNHQLTNLVRLLKNPADEDRRIALSTTRETRLVRPADIIRCESSNNYTTFYLAGGEPLVVSRPIYEYEDLLGDAGFIRCHQSHLVNKKFVKSWQKDHGDILVLTGGGEVPVSKRRKEEVKRWLQIT